MGNYKVGVLLFVLLNVAPADTSKKQSDPRFGPPEACSGWTALTNCIVAAFDKADVVALHDRHRQKGDSDLRITLVRNPMFANTVHNIVVEFGNSRHQAILRSIYCGGERNEAGLEAGMARYDAVEGVGFTVVRRILRRC